MNKKILVLSILAVLMLVAISFATAVSSNTTTTVKKKESPLFGIRTKLAIGERLQDLKENIKALFIGKRIFYLPFQLFRNEPCNSDLRATNKFVDTCYITGAGGCPCALGVRLGREW